MVVCCHHGCLVVGEQHTLAVMVTCKETVVKWLTMTLLYDMQHGKNASSLFDDVLGQNVLRSNQLCSFLLFPNICLVAVDFRGIEAN